MAGMLVAVGRGDSHTSQRIAAIAVLLKVHRGQVQKLISRATQQRGCKTAHFFIGLNCSKLRREEKKKGELRTRRGNYQLCVRSTQREH